MKTKIEPVALQVRKRGRVCTVAKITYFIGDDRPVLAVVWRGQRGTSEVVSLPPSVLEFAKAMGVQNFFLRNDKTGQMYSAPLTVFDQGWTGPDGERYIRLTSLRPTAWRQWRFAERTILLDGAEHEQEQTEVCQLELGV